ncbi:MAG TPA: BrnT family toxin [Candidatus Acidoferrum sp.]|nr:BrnT family toxin [Candidatus Acidoferrum sp.]
MRFEWDEEKNRLNLKRHKISFETASLVFDDPNAVTIPDRMHDDEEERFITLRRLEDIVILFVVHTDREADGEEVIRIISARKATPSERKIYEATQQRTAQGYRGTRRNERL